MPIHPNQKPIFPLFLGIWSLLIFALLLFLHWFSTTPPPPPPTPPSCTRWVGLAFLQQQIVLCQPSDPHEARAFLTKHLRSLARHCTLPLFPLPQHGQLLHLSIPPAPSTSKTNPPISPHPSPSTKHPSRSPHPSTSKTNPSILPYPSTSKTNSSILPYPSTSTKHPSRSPHPSDSTTKPSTLPYPSASTPPPTPQRPLCKTTLTMLPAPQRILLGIPLPLNHATAAELTAIPRLSRRLAAGIIAYRTQNGPFEQVEQLRKIRGIGPKTLQRIRPHLTLQSPPTLHAPQHPTP